MAVLCLTPERRASNQSGLSENPEQVSSHYRFLLLFFRKQVILMLWSIMVLSLKKGVFVLFADWLKRNSYVLTF